MTSAELGYQQKELEMLRNILKNRLRGEDYPERPGFESSGTPKALYDMFKEMESKALFYEKIVSAKLSNEKFIGINVELRQVYIQTDDDTELGLIYPENIIRIHLGGKKNVCHFSPEENPENDLEVDINISLEELFKLIENGR